MTKPLVSNLEDYKWSSYKLFVDQCVDYETQGYFSGKQTPSIIREIGFKQWVFNKLFDKETIESKSKTVAEDIKLIDVVSAIAIIYKLDINNILDSRKQAKKNSHVFMPTINERITKRNC